MRKESIVFLMPGRGSKGPAGGYKVVYEYANRLAEDGYSVTIVYPLTVNFKDQSIAWKLRVIPRFFQWLIKGVSGKKWFKLHPLIKNKMVLSLNWACVPHRDIYIATGVRTSYYLSRYPISKNRKFYLIQDFEAWGVSEDFVNNSYLLGLNNIVISDWLGDIVKKAGADYTIIKNGFDFNYFKLNNSIATRSSLKISMLYHKDDRKGCKYGIEALESLHEIYPDLEVSFFGVPQRPENLPIWIHYYRCPNQETHNKIYNDSSIFIAPSIQEGWGLTVGEAMICGAAVVCTETLGFKEMITNNENGLMVPIKDSVSLRDAIVFLISNPKERIRLATNGHKSIQDFSWTKAYERFKSTVGLS